MKKLFLTLVAGVALTSMVSAQSTDKGKWMLGGNISYDIEKVEDADGNTQQYSILPQVGYFVQDNLALGLGIGYHGSYQKMGTDDSSQGEFAIAPFVRHYQGDGDLKFFTQLSVPMGWGTVHENGDKTHTSERYGAAISPGVAYFPSSRVGIELSVRGLYYEYSSLEAENGSKVGVNHFGLNSNSFSPSIGVSFYF